MTKQDRAKRIAAREIAEAHKCVMLALQALRTGFNMPEDELFETEPGSMLQFIANDLTEAAEYAVPAPSQLHNAGCECISTEPDAGECRGCALACAPCYCLSQCPFCGGPIAPGEAECDCMVEDEAPAPILPSLVSAPETRLNGKVTR